MSEEGLLETDVINELAKEFITQPSAAVATKIADACRVEKNRFRFVNHDELVPSLVSHLDFETKRESVDGIVAALRAIGNLTFEIERTRKQVLEKNGVGPISLLLHSPHSSIRRVASGVVTNLVSASDDVQEAMIEAGVVPSLVSLLDDDDALVLALKGLGNLVSVESEKQVLLEKGLIPKFLAFMKEAEEYQDILAEVFDNLSHMIEVKEFWQEVKKGSGIDLTISILQMTDLEASCREKAYEFLIAIAKADSLRSELSPHFDLWLKMSHIANDPVLSATGAMMLAHLSLDDSDNKKLFGQLENLNLTPSSDLKVQMGQSMLLGNLPHCDEEAIKLAQNPAIFSLLSGYLKNESTDERVLHLVVAGLRNLSLPAVNKPLFKGFGLVEHAVRVGKASKNAPIKFECVRTVKSLLLSGNEFEEEFYNSGGVEFLVEVDESCVDDQAVRVALEAGRIWARLFENSEKISLLTKEDHFVSPLLKLLESQFAILQCEGAKALEVLYSSGKYNSLSEKTMGLVRKLSALLLDSDKVNSRTHCAKALNAISKSAGVDQIKGDSGDGAVNVEDLIGALGTLVFEEESKDQVEELRKKLATSP